MDALAVCYASELARWGIETTIVVPGSFTTGTNHFANAGKPEDEAVAKAYADGPTGSISDQALRGLAALSPPDADPAEVPRAIARVVDTPFGRRPFRVHIDPADDGAEAVNGVADRVRRELLKNIGLDDLLKPAGAKSVTTPDAGIVDVHQHFLPDFYRDALLAAGVVHPDGMAQIPPWSEADALAVMDRLGIAKSYVSISSPGVRLGDAAATAALSRGEPTRKPRACATDTPTGSISSPRHPYPTCPQPWRRSTTPSTTSMRTAWCSRAISTTSTWATPGSIPFTLNSTGVMLCCSCTRPVHIAAADCTRAASAPATTSRSVIRGRW